MFNEVFVLTTIRKLQQLEGSGSLSDYEDCERDLCSLWQMTVDEDVVWLLLNHRVIQLFLGVIEDSDDNRLVEIVLGIVRNMCCVPETRTELYYKKALLKGLCRFLSSTDTFVLMQLMEILTTILGREDEGYHWFKVIREVENIAEDISLILSSSTNKKLLELTLGVVYAMTNRFTEVEVDYGHLNEFYRIFARTCLMEGLMQACKQLFPVTAPNDRLLSNTDITIIYKFVEIQQNFWTNTTVYFNLEEQLVHCDYQMLLPMSNESWLIPLSGAKCELINSLYIVVSETRIFSAEVYLVMLQIFTILSKELDDLGYAIQEEQPDQPRNVENNVDPMFVELFENLLGYLYYMVQRETSQTIASALRCSSFNMETIENLCASMEYHMEGDLDLDKACDLLMESAHSAWNAIEIMRIE